MLEEITKPAPQGLCHQCREINRIGYLPNAVSGRSWDGDACSRRSAGELDYQELYNQLEAAIKQESGEHTRRLQDQRTLQSSTNDQTFGIPEQETRYTGQSRYA